MATKLYTQYLHRTADAGGLANFSGLLCGGMTAQNVSVALISSAEYSTNHPDNTSFVNAVYSDALGRVADSGGLASWTALILSGTTDESVLADFYGSAEYLTWATTH